MQNRFINCIRKEVFAAATGVMFLAMLQSAVASTIIVGPGVRNGDFNDDVSATSTRAFDVTPFWWNLGSGGQGTAATSTNLPFDGSRNAVIFSNPNRIHSLNTLYDIQLGDVFTVRYVWRDAGGWDVAHDRVTVRLYVTDTDLIGGTQTTLANILSGYSTLTNTYDSVTGFSSPAGASFAGKRLFVAVDIDDGNNDGNDFARFDNLEVIANQTIDEVPIGGLTRNGNFNADTSTDDSRSFGQTPEWMNLGTGGDLAEATRKLPAGSLYDGTRVAVIGSNPERIHAQNTFHTIQQGDVFQISYVWRDGVDFNHASDQIAARLFVTHNNAIGGTPTELTKFYSGLSRQNAAWQFAFGITEPAGASFHNKTLFVSIDIEGGGNRFARVDNFELVINPNQLLIPMFGGWGIAALIGLVAAVGGRKMYRRRSAS